MGKHSINNSNGKNVIKLKSILFFIIITGLVITLIISINKKKEDFTKQEEIINQAFSALKTTNINEVNKYTNYNKIICGLDESILNQEEVSEIEKNLFNTMEWSIEKIKKEDNNTVAIIEVTNKDFKMIITEWLQEIVNRKTNGEDISNEVGLKVLENILKNNNYGTQTVIKKVKIDKDSKIEVNDDLINLLYSGIESVSNAL